MIPTVVEHGLLGMQVCVPKEWSDDQVVEFAEGEHPSGTKSGWCVVKEGDLFLAGDPERAQCEAYLDYCHIALTV